MSELENILELFKTNDEEVRLELLLDFATRLPPITAEQIAARDAGGHRITGCITPVFLWMGEKQGVLTISGDAPAETPVVRGILSVLVHALSERSVSEAVRIPDDLVDRLMLGEVVGLRRRQGIGALVGHIKEKAAELAAGSGQDRNTSQGTSNLEDDPF